MKIAIVGGGASAMLLASRLKKYNVNIFEKNARLGKKLSMTGNGKCNFTNLDFDDLYDCFNNDFAIKIFKRHDNIDFCNFMISLGVIPKIEKHKSIEYVYPNTNNATTVVNALKNSIEDNGIKVIYKSSVKGIEHNGDKFYISVGLDGLKNNIIPFDKVVLATGGMSYKNTGSDGTGYIFAEKLGHKIIKPLPALCSLPTKKNYLKEFKGIRIDAKVSALCDNEIIYSEFGEIQFTENSISGIPIMNMSRYVNRLIDDYKSIILRLDFTNNFNLFNGKLYGDINEIKNINDFTNYLISLKSISPYKYSKDFLSGMFPNVISSYIMGFFTDSDLPISKLDNNKIKYIAQKICNFDIEIMGLSDFDRAQVTIGGVDTDEINIDTLESKLVRGLYFTGEVMDIDGKCGGYNLQLCYSTASIVAEALNNS